MLPRAIDPFTVAILSAVVLATLLPAEGRAASALATTSKAAVALLFFFHGAKLSRDAIRAGVGHVRLHALVFGTTFVVFPLLGLALRPLATRLVTTELYDGVLFLCALPATVQSAVVFTSIAGGNVSASICSASLSTVLGVVLTPLLVRVTSAAAAAGADGSGALASAGSTAAGIRDVVLHLLAPFVVGHLARPWLARWLERRARVVRFTDQATIVLVVYVAFSGAVIQHLWTRVPLRALAGVFVLDAALLSLVLAFTWLSSRRLGFAREDEIAIVFGGSKKSLASGIPMANVLFAPHVVGVKVLPLMIFHQLQLIASAVIARRYAGARTAEASGGPAPRGSEVSSSRRPQAGALERTAQRFARAAHRRSTYHYVTSKLRRDPVIRALAELGPHGDVLDLGCGRGQLAVYLLEGGLASRVRGFDWDEEKVALARRAAMGLDATFEARDVRDVEVAPASTVLLVDVLHYLPAEAQLSLLERAADLVAPGGMLVVRDATSSAGLRSTVTRSVEWLALAVRLNLGERIRIADVARDYVPPLERKGMTCRVEPCWGGTPFANVLLVAVRRPPPARSSSTPSV